MTDPTTPTERCEVMEGWTHIRTAELQEHAADLALAAAVRRLPRGWHLTNWGYRWEVREPQPVSVSRGSGATPTEAIEEALTDD